MDADLPYPLPPDLPAPIPPTEAPPREPAWSGLELAVIILFTLAAMLAISVIVALVWAILARSAGFQFQSFPELPLVAITLAGQTGGLAAGFAFAWLWISSVRATRFWPAIHWRWLSWPGVAAMLGTGVAIMIGVQILSSVLPMPPQVPMEKLFTPQTAWLLVVYGVGIAPFFEEFFFRGLLYPTLRSTFQSGMRSDELHAWRPLLRWLAGVSILGVLFWYWRLQIVAPASHAGAVLALILAGLLFVLALPGLPIAAVGWGLNRVAAWGKAEPLAILVTGFLFGLLHAAQLGWAWAAVLIMVLVGIALTALRAVTRTLTASWLCHCAYNGTLFVATYFGTQGFHNFTPGLH